MPEVAERSTVEQLKAARERITPEEAWTVGTFARNASGFSCPVDAPAASKWCADGSLAAELLVDTPDEGLLLRTILDGSPAYDFLSSAAREFSDSRPRPIDVNDDHGHAAALAMFDRATQLAEQEADRA